MNIAAYGAARPEPVIQTGDVDSLQDAMLRAWHKPRTWQKLAWIDDGIRAVICCPKTTKAGMNVWLWGYQLTVAGKIVWRHTKKPYV